MRNYRRGPDPAHSGMSQTRQQRTLVGRPEADVRPASRSKSAFDPLRTLALTAHGNGRLSEFTLRNLIAEKLVGWLC